MDNNKFKNVMERAQKLMLSEEFNSKVEKRSKNVKEGDDILEMEAALFGSGSDNTQSNTENQEIVNESICSRNGDHLPKAMMESFRKQPPMQGTFVDDMDQLSMIAKDLNKKEKKTINETVTYPQNGSIDYSLIKTIIDESVKRQLSEYGKTMLNESTGPSFKGMRFINGNTFQFLDNKGNLYEGVLKLKKRAK